MHLLHGAVMTRAGGRGRGGDRPLPLRGSQGLEHSKSYLSERMAKGEGNRGRRGSKWGRGNPRQHRGAGLRQKARLRAGLAFPCLQSLGAARPESQPAGCPRSAAGRRPHVEAQLSAAGPGSGRSGVRGWEPGCWGPGAGGGGTLGAEGPRAGSGGPGPPGPHAGSQPALCATLLNGAGLCARWLARISRAFP